MTWPIVPFSTSNVSFWCVWRCGGGTPPRRPPGTQFSNVNAAGDEDTSRNQPPVAAGRQRRLSGGRRERTQLGAGPLPPRRHAAALLRRRSSSRRGPTCPRPARARGRGGRTVLAQLPAPGGGGVGRALQAGELAPRRARREGQRQAGRGRGLQEEGHVSWGGGAGDGRGSRERKDRCYFARCNVTCSARFNRGRASRRPSGHPSPPRRRSPLCTGEASAPWRAPRRSVACAGRRRGTRNCSTVAARRKGAPLQPALRPVRSRAGIKPGNISISSISITTPQKLQRGPTATPAYAGCRRRDASHGQPPEVQTSAPRRGDSPPTSFPAPNARAQQG